MIKFEIGKDSIEFLSKSEFDLLNENEKEAYINGQLHLNDEDISWTEYEIRKIKGVGTGPKSNMGDAVMDEIWDECIKKLFSVEYERINDQFPEDKDSKLDAIYDFIDELEDEDWNKTRVFFINKVYSSENLYKLVLKKAEEASSNAQIITTKEQRKIASDLCLKYANESSNHINKLAIIALAIGLEFGIDDEKINEIVKGEKSINVYLLWFITVLWNQNGKASEDEMVKPFIELKTDLKNDAKALAENIDWITIERLWNGCLTKLGIELIN